MNKDQVEGRLKETEGKNQEAAGKLIGNKRMEKKGKERKNSGKFQSGYGDLKDNFDKTK